MPTSGLLSAATQTNPRTQEMQLARRGVTDPEEAEATAFEGGINGLWVAELGLPCDATSADELEIGFEFIGGPANAG